MDKKNDQISSGVMGVFGLLVSYGAYGLGYGGMRNPGPGFFPFWAGVFLFLISAYLFVKATLSKQSLSHESPWTGLRWKMLASITGSLFVYILLFNRLGFVIATFCLMVVLFKLEKTQTWRASILISAVTVGVAHIIFSVWLNLYFPKGIFGI